MIALGLWFANTIGHGKIPTGSPYGVTNAGGVGFDEKCAIT